LSKLKVLVTGGAGFIGSHLVEELLRLGHSIVVVDNLWTGRRENLPRDVTLIELDIRDRVALQRTLELERPEIVFHLAAQINVRKSLVDPLPDADVNVMGSLSLFQAALGNGVRRLIYASSGGAIYGDQAAYPCRESDAPRPSSPYGISKLAAEQYGRHLAETAGRDFVALRIANVYGPRQNSLCEAGVVALFLSKMLSGCAPTIFGDGGQTRDFIWVGDVVGAFVKSMHGPPGTYNVGTGKETRITDLYERLARVVGFSDAPRQAKEIFGELRRNALAVERSSQSLGWSPQTSLSTGLEATARFYKGTVLTLGAAGRRSVSHGK
jgi:UDP-glucose 4-epimerase